MKGAKEDKGRCGDCRHFIDDARELERALPGILILSSASGDTRGDQGICRIHDQFLMASAYCPKFQPRSASSQLVEAAFDASVSP